MPSHRDRAAQPERRLGDIHAHLVGEGQLRPRRHYRTFDFANLDVSKDSSVVFYCGSTMCTASDKAATRATAAGFTDVKAMREGIKGWKKAGKKTVDWSAPAETQKSAS